MLERAIGDFSMSSKNKRGGFFHMERLYVVPRGSESQRWQGSPPKKFSILQGLSFQTLQSQELGSFSSSRDETNGFIGVNSTFWE